LELTNLEHQAVLEIIVCKRRTVEIFLAMRAIIWLHLQALSQSYPTMVGKLTLMEAAKEIKQHTMDKIQIT